MKQEELNIEKAELAVGVAKAKPYSPEELAILLGVTRRTIYNYIYTKKVEAYKVNRSWRVKYSEVAKLAGWC